MIRSIELLKLVEGLPSSVDNVASKRLLIQLGVQLGLYDLMNKWLYPADFAAIAQNAGLLYRGKDVSTQAVKEILEKFSATAQTITAGHCKFERSQKDAVTKYRCSFQPANTNALVGSTWFEKQQGSQMGGAK